METVVGVFNSQDEAARAAAHLRSTGFEDINLLMPGAGDAQIKAITTPASEQPGMGKAMGGGVGAAPGIPRRLELGTLDAARIVAAVAPVFPVGLAAAAG